MIPRTSEFARARAQELIGYYDNKHQENPKHYTYTRLAAIAHQAYLKHKAIETDRKVYQILESDMKKKGLHELGLAIA